MKNQLEEQNIKIIIEKITKNAEYYTTGFSTKTLQDLRKQRDTETALGFLKSFKQTFQIYFNTISPDLNFNLSEKEFKEEIDKWLVKNKSVLSLKIRSSLHKNLLLIFVIINNIQKSLPEINNSNITKKLFDPINLIILNFNQTRILLERSPELIDTASKCKTSIIDLKINHHHLEFQLKTNISFFSSFNLAEKIIHEMISILKNTLVTLEMASEIPFITIKRHLALLPNPQILVNQLWRATSRNEIAYTTTPESQLVMRSSIKQLFLTFEQYAKKHDNLMEQISRIISKPSPLRNVVEIQMPTPPPTRLSKFMK